MTNKSLAMGGLFLAGVTVGGLLVWFLIPIRPDAPVQSAPSTSIERAPDRITSAVEKPVRTEPDPARELSTEAASTVVSSAAPKDAVAKERPKEPVLQGGADGPTLTEIWAKDLGITDAQLQAINTSLKSTWEEWRQLEDAHIRFEGRKIDDKGTERLSYRIEAFADDGAQLKELLAADLAACLTEDQKASTMPVLHEAVAKEFRGFGTHERRLELSHYADGTYGSTETRPDLADLGARVPGQPPGRSIAVATKGKVLPPAYQHLWH